LKEAKELVDGAPKPVKEGASKAEADEIVAKLKEAGAEVVEVSLPSLVLGLAVYYVLCPAEVSSNLSRYDGQRYGFTYNNAKDIDESYFQSREIGFGKEAKRRTQIQEVSSEQEFSAEELIVAEDAYVIVTADGWVKRQKEIKDVSTTRLREGDAVLACEIGSTRASMVFLSNFGTAYTSRIIDVPATSGYGEPIQKLFKLKDGERIIAAFSLDARVIGDVSERDGKRPLTYGVAVTSDGYSLAFGLSTFLEPSTRAGRRFAKPAEGVEVVGAGKASGNEIAICATKHRRALLAPVSEINYLSGPGKGVVFIKLDESDDAVVGFMVAKDKKHALVLESSGGGERSVSASEYKPTGRGGKGHEVLKRGSLVRAIPQPPEAPAPLEA
jgi:DNA gyrase subunit A